MENKKRLIDANVISEHKFPLTPLRYHVGWNDAIDAIVENAPTVDAVEVVHGRWDGNGNCSACGKNIYKDIDADMWSCYEPPYCPNCGAKMDGK